MAALILTMIVQAVVCCWRPSPAGAQDQLKWAMNNLAVLSKKKQKYHFPQWEDWLRNNRPESPASTWTRFTPHLEQGLVWSSFKWDQGVKKYDNQGLGFRAGLGLQKRSGAVKTNWGLIYSERRLRYEATFGAAVSSGQAADLKESSLAGKITVPFR